MKTKNRILLPSGDRLPLLLALAFLAVVPFLSLRADSAPRVVDITAKRFGFTPNLITLQKGEPVTLRITSLDVSHGFFMRALKIDEVIAAGKTTELTITPQNAGRFTTICDHFCGAGHGNMSMTIVVE